MDTELQNLSDIAERLRAEGIDVAEIMRGESYKDCSIVAIIPTRDKIHPRVVQHWLQLIRPMNQRFAMFFVQGHEVGVAYNEAIAKIQSDPKLGTFKHYLTMEDDNLVPPFAIYMLLETMLRGGYDAVSGLYHMKGPLNVPMAFGQPGALNDDGQLDMTPRNVTEALLNLEAIEVNGIACGCALWKADVFRDVSAPWFNTWTRMDAQGNLEVVTQDIDFCRKAREKGKRLAVDTRVRVGHLDVSTGQVY